MGEPPTSGEAGAFDPRTLRDLAQDMAARSRGDVWSAPPQALLRAAHVAPPPRSPPPRLGAWILRGGLAVLVGGCLVALVTQPVADFRPDLTPTPTASPPAAPALLAPAGPLPDWVLDPPPAPPPPAAAPKPAPEPVVAEARSDPRTDRPRVEAKKERPRPARRRAEARPPPPALPATPPAPPPIRASFDCAQAATTVERRVCSNARLAAADRAVAAAYARAEAAGVSARSLRRQQRSWTAERERLAEEQPEALVGLYEQRMDELHLQAERAEARRRR